MINSTFINESEARRVMASGLGRAELEFATSICAPLYWIIRDLDGKLRPRNGTAFFLDAGEGVFAVTAAHVLTGLDSDLRDNDVVAVQLGRDLVLDFADKHAVISRDDMLDIATFQITEPEVRFLGKSILTGFQSTWPPAPPQLDKGVYFSGFAGQETMWVGPTEISFAAVPGAGVADAVGRHDITTVFNRNQWIDVMGLGLPPTRYDFGGISGGPLISVIESGVIRSWTLAGVIYEGPNPSSQSDHAIEGFETIKARRAHFIKADGSLDRSMWDR
jgi:hypothetical protein